MRKILYHTISYIILLIQDVKSESSFSDKDDSDDDGWAPDDEEDKESVSKRDSKYPLDSNMPQAKKRKISKLPENVAETEQPLDTEKLEATSERRKFSCPLVACKAEVIHLPRHMRNVHQWTKEAASKVLSKYNIRKRKNSSVKKKDYHSRRRCSLSGCHSIVLRISAHLQKVHKLEKTSKEYCAAMRNSIVVPDHRHPMIVWQEERLRTKKWGEKATTELSKYTADEGSSDEEMEDKGYPSDDNANLDSEYEIESDNDSDVERDDDDDAATGSRSNGETAPTMPPLLVEFEDWLRSPDGGKRDEKTAKQHSAQLFNMLKVIDETENVQSLLDVKLVRNVFLKTYVAKKKYEAGTIKSYLMSLRHFCSFLVSDRPDGIQFNKEDVDTTREKVKLWSVSYKREANTRKWMKLEEDTINRLTPENIRKFEKSEAAREAIKTIGRHFDSTQTTVVTQKSYTLVRDFLFAQTLIDNANRPGVLAHMTMHEYNRMQKQDDHYVITVMKHKTAHVHGPARIVLNEKLKSWFSVFVELMRPQITGATSGNVFLSWNGNPMISGHITKAIQSLFKKSEIEMKITSTSFRKAAVTRVHSDEPNLSGKLAVHMAHNQATAKKYYLLTETSKESVEVSKQLGKLMRSSDVTESDPLSDREVKKSADKEETVPKHSAGDHDSLANVAEQGNKKTPWSDEDVQKISEIFKDEISNKTISLDTVRSRIETNEELRGMSPRRVYDKIKKVMNKESGLSDAVSELPARSESLEDRVSRLESDGNQIAETTTNDDQLSNSIIAPTERNSNFSNLELDTLHELFRDMIVEGKKICRIEVEKRCSGNQEGRKLLNKLSVLQLVNRIKYERRKKQLSKKR